MDESTGEPPHPGPSAADELPSLGIAAGSAGNHAQVYSIQSVNHLSGFLSPDQCLRSFNNFKRSSAPWRFLLFSEDAWADVAHQVFDDLKAGFLAGKTTFEVTVDGKPYLFDFIGMSRIDPANGGQNSIAWINVDGRCFFPRNAVDENANRSSGKMELGLIRIHKNSLECQNPVQVKKGCKRKVYDESAPEVSSTGVSKHRWPGAVKLREDDNFYKVVQELFLSGIKTFASNTFITSIHGCSDSIPQNMVSSFQFHMRVTAGVRGNANVNFGWYGASASNIAAILSHGFGQQHRRGMMGLGVGIHLASSHASHASAMQSEADDSGERHMLLCRIILGNLEKVELGSTQDHPSNECYDSGVDDPLNPKWYVVWSYNMRTHILPDYIVSFRTLSKGKPSFSKLLSEVGKSLPASKLQALEISYKQYMEGKINRETLIRYLRSIAGDDLLTSTIKRLKLSKVF